MNFISIYGIAQQYIHATNIKKEVGYLGLYERILGVGGDHYMSFQEGINRPFWMTPKELVATKFSQHDQSSLKDNTEDELIGNIKISGIDMYVLKGKKVNYLQDIAHENSISVENRIRK